MKQQGIITSIDKGIAKIRIERESACGGNCASCKGCAADTLFICQPVGREFAAGDHVQLIKKTGTVIFEAFLGYGFPSAVFILGAVLGYHFWHTERASLLLGAAGLILSIVCVKILSKYIQQTFIIKKLEESK